MASPSREDFMNDYKALAKLHKKKIKKSKKKKKADKGDEANESDIDDNSYPYKTSEIEELFENLNKRFKEIKCRNNYFTIQMCQLDHNIYHLILALLNIGEQQL